MELSKRAAYLQGLVDGLGVDESTKEGKIIKAMSALLAEMAEALEGMDEDLSRAYDQINDLSDELEDLEADLYEEEDDEDQCVMFGSSTANFSAVPAAKHQWNRPLSSVQPPRAGMMVFGVLRANGTMELANTQPTLHVDDKILFAELAD